MTKHAASLVLGALVLCAAPRAEAHRLDEYLEQTLLEIEPNRVVLYVDLTPGVAVAPEVIPRIDTDHDGVLSASEQAVYTEQVRRDLSLSMNDAPMPLRLIESSYPTVDSMTKGVGLIALTFEASLSPGARSGTLRFVNHHAPSKAVYLVNSLMPRAPGVHVVSQSRSDEQASYQVELAFDTATKLPVGLRNGAWVVALILAGVFLCWRAIKPSAASRPGSRLLSAPLLCWARRSRSPRRCAQPARIE